MPNGRPDIRFVCPVKICSRALKSKSTWTRHLRTAHPLHVISQDPEIVTLPILPTLHDRQSIQVSPPTSPPNYPRSPEYENNDWGTGESFADPDVMDGTFCSLLHPFNNGLPLHLEDAPSCSDPIHLEHDVEYHSFIDGKLRSYKFFPLLILIGKICARNGSSPSAFPDTPPSLSPASEQPASNDWAPFRDCNAFDLAHYFFKEDQTSAAKIDRILNIMARTLEVHGDQPPFETHKDVYSTIDAIPIGGVPWQSSSFKYDGPKPENPPKWMDAEYAIWYRDPHQLFLNMLRNPDFENSFDYAPYQQYDEKGNRRYQHFMSGDWAWKQAVCLYFTLIMILTDVSPEYPCTRP